MLVLTLAAPLELILTNGWGALKRDQCLLYALFKVEVFVVEKINLQDARASIKQSFTPDNAELGAEW